MPRTHATPTIWLGIATAFALFLIASRSIGLGFPTTATAAPTLSDDDKQAILAQHNAARTMLNLAPLTWDNNLTAVATEWANMLAAGTVTGHRPNNQYGENLWQASPPDSTPITDAVTSWLAEGGDFDAPSNTCAAGKVCGHYTQVVWNTTTKVGCAKASGGNWDYIICNYDPPGNITGVSPFAPAPGGNPPPANPPGGNPPAGTQPGGTVAPTGDQPSSPPPGPAAKATFALLGFSADTFAVTDPFIPSGAGIVAPNCGPQTLFAGVHQANLPVGTTIATAWTFNGTAIPQDPPFQSATTDDDVTYSLNGTDVLQPGVYQFTLQAAGSVVAQGTVRVTC